MDNFAGVRRGCWGNLRSARRPFPAPPVVALLGLFGMLVGEQLIPVGRRLLSREPLTLAWFRHECVPKISGTAPLRPRRTIATFNDLLEERQHDAAVAHCHH
jgi:xanthosine utilization system XapX-like protein